MGGEGVAEVKNLIKMQEEKLRWTLWIIFTETGTYSGTYGYGIGGLTLHLAMSC